ncbi:MAG: ArsR/SmtB family transcription factor [Candidatus Zixiibacteriota bacterium]
MNKNEIERLSEIFKALGNKWRLQMVLGIYEDECNVSRIVEKLGLPQSTVSQHLSVLRSRGIITGRREGKRVCYKVTDETVICMIKALKKES